MLDFISGLLVAPAIIALFCLFRWPIEWIFVRIDQGISSFWCRIGMHDYDDGHPEFEPDQVVCWRCGKEQGVSDGR